MCDYPNLNKKLFIDTGHLGEVAVLGKGTISDQFYDYTTGYFKAANHLIDYGLQTEQKYRDIFPPDRVKEKVQEETNSLAPPICFLYRQYFELTLKDILITYSNNEEDKKRVVESREHNLEKIWCVAKPVFEQVIENDNVEMQRGLAGLERYILYINGFDQSSASFRYPITVESTKVFKKEERINLRYLRERMEECEQFISDAMAEMDLVFKCLEKAKT